jgi:hypothetical protein
MARRKQPPGPDAAAVELPERLRRDVVVVEDFVSWDESLPSWRRDDDFDPWPHPSWRRIRSLRRWQDAVRAWGTEYGLDRTALGQLGYWPTRPPRFGDPSRLTGQRFY